MGMKMLSVILGLGVFASVILAARLFGASPENGEALAALKELKIENGKIVSVEWSDSPTFKLPEGRILNSLPPRTVVKIVLNPAKGSSINIEAWLPDAAKWNGRFLGLGNGGAAGNINPGGLVGNSAAGYAVITTDMGTAPNASSGNGNPEVWKDFGYRSTHLMTVVGKKLVKVFYGKDPVFSYFSGGSTGGQQALQEAQRYPEDYDGILANIPAHCRTPLHAYFLWNDQILAKCPFTTSQQTNVMEAGVEFMAKRELPETAGKMVSDPRYTASDIEAVIQLALAKDSSLTAEHAGALRKLFDGPRREETGERIFSGIPFGSALSSAHGNLYLFNWVFGAEKKLADINFGKDIDTYTATLGPYLNAENPDLNAFEKRGGKLIMASGSADSVVPFHATLDYYERVVETFGSLEKVGSFFRYYIIPGMGHGLGQGPGINNLPSLLDAVIRWREKGEAPEALRARRIVDGKTEMDFPIYPYPKKTSGDAASGYKPVEGQRGGVERVSEKFRPASTE